MRGKATSIAKTKADHVLIAVKYESRGGELRVAKGFSRTGAVWSDLRLFDRPDLLRRLRAGEKVVTGSLADLEGDYEVGPSIRLRELDGPGAILLANGRDAARDDLGLPLF